jgi:hypothetical protein
LDSRKTIRPTISPFNQKRLFSSSSGGSYFFWIVFAGTFFFFFFVDPSCSWIAPERAIELIIESILSLSLSVYHILFGSGRERCATMGTAGRENPS